MVLPAPLRRLLRERLAVRSPDALVGSTLAWALYGLEDDDAPPSLLHGLALLATGGFAAADRLARRMAETLERPDDGAALDALLLLSRYLAWTGDPAPLHAVWPQVRRAAEHASAQEDDDLGRAAVRAAVLRDLAVAAETIGDEAMAASLRRMEPTARQAAAAAFRAAHPTDPATSRALAFGAVDPLDASAWYQAKAGEETPERAGWVSWAEYAGGRGGVAYRHWSTAAREAFGPTRETWEAGLVGTGGGDLEGAPPAKATALVLPLVHGLLGATPDAPRHRLQLRPQFPAAWESAEARRIRMGDAEITLRYHREGDLHTFRLEQESGAIPATVVFEPLLPGRRLVDAHVDGQAAALDPRPLGERMLVPVQLVLDAERVVTLLVGHEAEPERRGRELRVL